MEPFYELIHVIIGCCLSTLIALCEQTAIDVFPAGPCCRRPCSAAIRAAFSGQSGPYYTAAFGNGQSRGDSALLICIDSCPRRLCLLN